jgi:hypothetical protein
MNLQSFCRKGSGFNTYLTKPFQFDDALVATDGAIIVSIKNDKTPSRDTAPCSIADELAKIITKLQQQTYTPQERIRTTEQKECDACLGAMVLEYALCHRCNGEGKIYVRKRVIHVRGVRINPYYAALISQLPNLETGSNADRTELYFKSGEHVGLCMGMVTKGDNNAHSCARPAANTAETRVAAHD